MDKRGNGLGVSAKKGATPPPPPSSSSSSLAVDSDGVGLGLKLQITGSLPKNASSTSTDPMMRNHCPSPSSSKPKQTGGPSSPTSPAMDCRSMRSNGTTYDDDYDNIAAAPTTNTTPTCCFENTTPPPPPPPPPLQPFDNSPVSTTAYKFAAAAAGGREIEMATTMGFPFTAAQWKELERQAMIYKYMVASVPVPYELLLPIAQNLPASHSPLVNQLRCSTKQDPEPGRCKRTDGKKWRCSREVAPNQKYCERHMHRGRPRSRKHVELSQFPDDNNNNRTSSSCKKSRLPNPCSSPFQSSTCKVVGSTVLPSTTESPLFLDNNHTKNDQNRGLDWTMNCESEQQWRQIMQASHSVFQHGFGEDPPSNLPSFSDFGTSHDFLRTETPRRDFIDAWSNDKTNVIKDSSVSTSGNISPSALNLSMAMALDNGIDHEEFGQIQMGLGVTDRDHPKATQVSTLASPVSWAGSTPGGPLAEVLRPSTVAVSSTPASPYPAADGESISTPATTASSPTGVLQRTMLSQSDGSVCNSPTLAASSSKTPTPDIVAFQWFT